MTLSSYLLVTLACTAAFAACSTALLFIIFLSSQPNDSNNPLTRIQPRFTQPIVKCDNQQRCEHVVGNVESTTASATTIKPISRSYGRRSLTSRVQQPTDGLKKQAPIGVIWLMVRLCRLYSYFVASPNYLANTNTLLSIDYTCSHFQTLAPAIRFTVLGNLQTPLLQQIMVWRVILKMKKVNLFSRETMALKVPFSNLFLTGLLIYHSLSSQRHTVEGFLLHINHHLISKHPGRS